MSKSKAALEKPLEDTAQADETPKEEKVKKQKKEKHAASLKGPLCKIVKNSDIEKHFGEYQALVNPPAFICKKCGRAAADKKSLCKPVRIG